MAVLENLLTQYHPQLYITNTQLHNPTGASYSVATTFQVLRLAERHGLRVVEDNVSADLVPGRSVTLAAADQLRRVVYVGSFSKSVAPGLRVGFVVAEPGLLEELVYYKLVSGLSSSAINERLVHAIFMEGHLRKHLEQLRDRLAKAQERTCRRLENAGFKLFFEPGAGMFVWARPADETVDTLQLAQMALSQNILLAPGHLFRTDLSPCPWMRFNVAYCDSDRLFTLMDEALAACRQQGPRETRAAVSGKPDGRSSFLNNLKKTTNIVYGIIQTLFLPVVMARVSAQSRVLANTVRFRKKGIVPVRDDLRSIGFTPSSEPQF